MKRINSDDRMLIQACLEAQTSISEIAMRLKKHKSSISREISSHIEIHEGYFEKPCIHDKEYENLRKTERLMSLLKESLARSF